MNRAPGSASASRGNPSHHARAASAARRMARANPASAASSAASSSISIPTAGPISERDSPRAPSATTRSPSAQSAPCWS